MGGRILGSAVVLVRFGSTVTRHREHLFDLPSRVQCRCRKESICENGALLWHLHRIYRLDVLRRVGNASVSMCGFVP